ncbi:hypothetical protein MASR1M48_03800 [Lactococcus petauri]
MLNFCIKDKNFKTKNKSQNGIFFNKIIQRILFYYVLNSLHDKLVISTLKKDKYFNKN